MKLNTLELGTIHLGWVELGTIQNSVCALFHSHNLNCALFPYHQIELCLIPAPSNWIRSYSNTIKLKCALFQWPQIVLCLIPMPSNQIVPKSISPGTKFMHYFRISTILPIFSYLNNGIRHKFDLTTLELGTIKILDIGIRHNLILAHWIKAQFRLATME